MVVFSRSGQDRRLLWWAVCVAIGAGIVSLLSFLFSIIVSFRLDMAHAGGTRHLLAWVPFVLAVVVLAYAAVQVLPTWITYGAAARAALNPKVSPAEAEWPHDLTVDVFVTAYKEPVELVDRALSAACQMQGAHRTYLLDDGHDPALERLAAQRGAGYITRTDNRDAKAGNLNHAIGITNGDVIAVFDIDHVPAPDYLVQSMRHFANPQVGFVQTMITFAPNPSYWVAAAAAETSFDYYNPTSKGMDALGGVSMMGTNSLMRRSALVSIGGYQPGLAEDLATSIALHGAGWQSAYVAEPLAPGLAPLNVAAWVTQQFKWARGVFEVLLNDYGRLFKHLTSGQRICYLVRMTKYLIGTVFAIHLIATALLLVWSSFAEKQALQHYLLVVAPLAASDLIVRQIALAAARHPSLKATSLWRAIGLVFYSWPVYTLAWIMAVLRLPLDFRPTPKGTEERLAPIWIVPQALSVMVLAYGVTTTVLQEGQTRLWGLLLLGAAQCLLQFMVLCQRIRPSRIRNYILEARADSATVLTENSVYRSR